MKSESLGDPNSLDGDDFVESGAAQPPAQNGQQDVEPKNRSESPLAISKRQPQRIGAEREQLAIPQSYVVPAYSVNGALPRRPEESVDSDLRATLRLLREKIWLIIVCVLLAIAAGVVDILISPKIYRAEAVVQVEQEAPKILQGGSVDAPDLKAEELPKTIEQSMASPQLLLGLIQRNSFGNDPEFLPGLKRPVSETKMVEELAKQISVQVRRGTWLIDIKVQDRSPIMAQKIADLLIGEFTYENLRRHVEGSEMSSEFLMQKAERLKAKLAKSEEAMQSYKEEHQAVALGEKGNTTEEKLLAFNHLLTDAKANRLKLEPDYEEIKKLGTSQPVDLLAIPSIANAPSVVDLEKVITLKEAELANLKKWYGQRHPNYVALMSELEELKADLDRKIVAAATEVTSAYDSAAASEKKMEEALQEQEKAVLQLSKMAISYNALRQEADSDRALYESVLNRLKETDATKDAAQNAIRVISHPLLPEVPVSPHKSRILLLSILGGFGLGCGLALLSKTLDRSFKTADQAERVLGVPALADIPKAAKMKFHNDCLVLVKQPGSAAAESFRNLRASLSLLSKDELCKTLLFSSAVPSEGKSFCAINCAVAFAQQGLETLLIDADLRSPTIHRVFFDETVAKEPIKGLTDVLTGQMVSDAAVQCTRIEKLSVLCAGTGVRTPAELLASEACGRMIQEAQEKFDRVVINSAPIHFVSDALLLVRHVQGICLVISPQSSAEAISQAVQKLGTARSKLIGFVFDRYTLRRNTNFSYPYSQPSNTGIDG